MKTKLFLFGLLCIAAEVVFGQQNFKNLPLIKSARESIDIRIGNSWDKNRWRIAPEVPADTLNAIIYGNAENVGFRTDQDTVIFSVKPGNPVSFYIKLNDKNPALTVINPIAFTWDQIAYDKNKTDKKIKLYYADNRPKYFDTLKKTYPLNNIIARSINEEDAVLSILNWTNKRWKHDGNNSPLGNTGLAILNEAAAGGRFPCFAYAIVLRDQLIANGFVARTIYLKTKDAETRKGSPGHVATEVYLKNLRKWVFIDGQFNVMPKLNGIPLNAVEFQDALSKHYESVVLASKDSVSKTDYTRFVYDYLYYFDTSIDNRLVSTEMKNKINGKTSLMLVPLGASDLKHINFWNSDINYCIYTNSINDFYAAPF